MFHSSHFIFDKTGLDGQKQKVFTPIHCCINGHFLCCQDFHKKRFHLSEPNSKELYCKPLLQANFYAYCSLLFVMIMFPGINIWLLFLVRNVRVFGRFFINPEGERGATLDRLASDMLGEMRLPLNRGFSIT